MLMLLLIGAIAGFVVVVQQAAGQRRRWPRRGRRRRGCSARWRRQQETARPKVSEAQAVLDFFKENLLAAAPDAEAEDSRGRTPRRARRSNGPRRPSNPPPSRTPR